MLRLIEHGAYTVLLDAYYSLECPLPESYEDLYRVCRAMDEVEREAVRKVADKYFPVGADGCRHNDRADEEIGKARPRIDAARDNGRRGGRRPVDNPVDNPADNPLGSPVDNPPGMPPANPVAKLSTTTTTTIPRTTSTPKRKAKAKAATAPLPQWLADCNLTDLWQHWREERRAMKAPLTVHAETLLLVKLDKLRAAGHDARAVIEQSIERRWRGLFPLDAPRMNGHARSEPSSWQQDQRDKMADLTGRAKRGTIIEAHRHGDDERSKE